MFQAEKYGQCDLGIGRHESRGVLKSNVLSCWPQSGLGFLLSVLRGTTGGFRAWKWHDTCF